MTVQTMFADKNGNALILETASGKNDILLYIVMQTIIRI